MSLDGIYVVGGKGTNLIPVPWICFSQERLITYTKLAVLQSDPTVNQANARSLQASFLTKAVELTDVLLNPAELTSSNTSPRYSPLCNQFTASSKRQPPNIFSQQRGTNVPTPTVQLFRTDEELNRDANILRTRGCTSAQLKTNALLRQIRTGAEEKYFFRPETQEVKFKHTAPERINPGLSDSRNHVVVKDFREVLHQLSGMEVEKKDLPKIWYLLIERFRTLKDVSKTGQKERDALLLPHCLAFSMKMIFNLTNLLASVTDLHKRGTLRVERSDQAKFGKYLANFELSRDLLSQFEKETDEFFHAHSWADLPPASKKEKVGMFYHHFSLKSCDQPQPWMKNNFASYMSTESANLWKLYFAKLPQFRQNSSTDREPRSVFQKKATAKKGNTFHKPNNYTQPSRDSNRKRRRGGQDQKRKRTSGRDRRGGQGNRSGRDRRSGQGKKGRGRGTGKPVAQGKPKKIKKEG